MSATGIASGPIGPTITKLAPNVDLKKCICHLAYVAEAGVAKILTGRAACRVHNDVQIESVVARELPQEKKL